MEIKNKEDLFTYLTEMETKLTSMQEALDSQNTTEPDKPDGEDESKGEDEEMTEKEVNDLDDFFNDEK